MASNQGTNSNGPGPQGSGPTSSPPGPQGPGKKRPRSEDASDGYSKTLARFAKESKGRAAKRAKHLLDAPPPTGADAEGLKQLKIVSSRNINQYGKGPQRFQNAADPNAGTPDAAAFISKVSDRSVVGLTRSDNETAAAILGSMAHVPKPPEGYGVNWAWKYVPLTGGTAGQGFTAPVTIPGQGQIAGPSAAAKPTEVPMSGPSSGRPIGSGAEKAPPMPSQKWCDEMKERFEVFNLTDECANCHKTGHSAIQCIWPNHQGAVYPCGLCNNGTHSIDRCHSTLRWTWVQWYVVLCEFRSGKVPLVGGWNPLELVAKYHRLRPGAPVSAPVSISHAKSIKKNFADRYETYEYGKEYPFPEDPLLATQEQILGADLAITEYVPTSAMKKEKRRNSRAAKASEPTPPPADPYKISLPEKSKTRRFIGNYELIRPEDELISPGISDEARRKWEARQATLAREREEAEREAAEREEAERQEAERQRQGTAKFPSWRDTDPPEYEAGSLYREVESGLDEADDDYYGEADDDYVQY